MENFSPISATLGGALIGLSAVLLMAGAGRIAGISGIIGGLFRKLDNFDRYWRLAFLTGLIVTPLVMVTFNEGLDVVQYKSKGWTLMFAGLLVGFGTQLGNGCTSGHGVCGNARLSERSFIATLVFMATGIVTVFLSVYLGLY